MMPLVDLDNFKPTWKQRLHIQLYGNLYLGHYQKPGYVAPAPFYAFRCCKHGIVVDRPYGYDERLDCPKCLDEKKSDTD